ncbi:MAG: NUDIX hydrolase [Clostridia bacterium]|nr:NUDIX hydrolase [Clostridia bacterium]
MNLSEKKLKGKTIYDGKILKLEVDEVRLPDGSTSVRECVRHHGGAAVLLVDRRKVLLVKQFRYLYGKELYEIPAGKLEKGEEAIKAAARELEEETGYRAQLVRLFELYPSVGYTDEVIHIYFAEKFEYVGRKLDEGEFLDCEFIEIEKVLKLIESGEICDAKTVAAVYAYLNLNKN